MSRNKADGSEVMVNVADFQRTRDSVSRLVCVLSAEIFRVALPEAK